MQDQGSQLASRSQFNLSQPSEHSSHDEDLSFAFTTSRPIFYLSIAFGVRFSFRSENTKNAKSLEPDMDYWWNWRGIYTMRVDSYLVGTQSPKIDIQWPVLHTVGQRPV